MSKKLSEEDLNKFKVPLKGTKKDHEGPAHLWPNEFANDPLFRKFKGDSKVNKIKHPSKQPALSSKKR